MLEVTGQLGAGRRHRTWMTRDVQISSSLSLGCFTFSGGGYGPSHLNTWMAIAALLTHPLDGPSVRSPLWRTRYVTEGKVTLCLTFDLSCPELLPGNENSRRASGEHRRGASVVVVGPQLSCWRPSRLGDRVAAF
jgi:hypothetical protein